MVPRLPRLRVPGALKQKIISQELESVGLSDSLPPSFTSTTRPLTTRHLTGVLKIINSIFSANITPPSTPA